MACTDWLQQSHAASEMVDAAQLSLWTVPLGDQEVAPVREVRVSESAQGGLLQGAWE